jgi:CBS domain-containing protein
VSGTHTFGILARATNCVTGVLPRDWALGHPSKIRSARRLADVALQDYVTVSKDATIVDLLARMVTHRAAVAVVVAPPSDAPGAGVGRVLGVVTKSTLVETLAEGMELFGD